MMRAAVLPIAAVVLLAGPVASGKEGKPTYPRVANSTAYCTGSITASGRAPGKRTVAMNRHPLGTKIQTKRPGPGGIRRWIVQDRIGWGSEMDFYTTCDRMNRWGRRDMSYRVGWK